MPTTSRFTNGLNDAQAEAVVHAGSPLLVVAGPGSGKTRVLTHRIAHLLDTGVDPTRVLAVTFTNKAAAEMATRVHSLVGPGAEGSVISTFHSFCVRVLRWHHEQVNLPRWFTIVDPSDAEKVMRSVLADDDDDPTQARHFLSQISYQKNTLTSNEDFAATSPTAAAVARAWDKYQQRLLEMGAADFDDLLLHTRDLLATDAGAAVSRRFDKILIDEWQDTCAAQYDIVVRLAGLERAGRDVCVVGDPMQSIYSWRGSTPEVVEHFVRDFSPSVIELGHNYRSSANIVAVADAVAASAKTAVRAALHTTNASGPPVEIHEFADPDDECTKVVRDLTSRSGTRAVLVRTNAQTRVFELALSAAGVAHQVVGAVRFTDRAEVKDALAYLKVLVNPNDEISFARAAAVPRRKLGEVSLRSYISTCRHHGHAPGTALDHLEEFTELPARVRTPLEAFAGDLRAVRDAAVYGPAAAVRAVLATGLRSFHSADPERVQNLDELIAYAESFENGGMFAGVAELADLDGPARVEAFVQAVSLSSSTDQVEHASVSVITAHASKGREFDHVWVVGAEEGILPHSLSRTPSEVEEERRLFFVAVSRARAGLTVSYRRRHFLNGEWSDSSPSRFLEAIEHLADVSYRSAAGHTSSAASSRHRRPRRPAWSPSMTPPKIRSAPSTVAGPRLSPADATPGAAVSHPTFGSGTVLGCAGTVATIRFDGRDRTLDLSFAPLSLTS
jgi:DNA helicase II / ATP-dependent DNA helicase PcrA